jgi:hypothetical protein
VQVCHEWNTAVHVADYQGRPGRRPFTRTELQAFFGFADAQVAAGRKGWMAAFRDATLFKVAQRRADARAAFPETGNRTAKNSNSAMVSSAAPIRANARSGIVRGASIVPISTAADRAIPAAARASTRGSSARTSVVTSRAISAASL